MLKEKYLGYTAGEQVNEAIKYYQKDQLDCLSLFNQIAIIGDSLTVGHVDRYTVYSKDGNNKIVGASGRGATPDSNWPACLAKQYPGMSIHTFGLSGEGFHGWNGTFSSDIDTYISQEGFPQLFIISLAANDIKDYLPGDNSDIVDKYYTTSQLSDSNTNTSVVKYASNLVRFIQEKTTMTTGSQSGKVYTKIIILGYPNGLANDEPYYASYQNPRSGNQDDYEIALKNMCDAMGIMYVESSEDPYFSSDEFLSTINYNHNNGVGYAGMAAAYARAINKCIADNGGRYPSQESKDTVNVTYETGYFSDCNYAFATSSTKLNIESNPLYRAISDYNSIKFETNSYTPQFSSNGTNFYTNYVRCGNVVELTGGYYLSAATAMLTMVDGLPYKPEQFSPYGYAQVLDTSGSLPTVTVPYVQSTSATNTKYNQPYTMPWICLTTSVSAGKMLLYTIKYTTSESFKNQ